MVESCGMQCVKLLLIIFNFLFFLAGLILVGVGAYTLNAMNANHLSDVVSANGPAIFIVLIGVLIMLFAFFGCAGAWFESTCMLNTFAILLILVLLLQLAAGIAGFVTRNRIGASIKNSMVALIPEYEQGSNNTATKIYDSLQKEFKCCGFDGPMDYKKNVALDNTTSVPDTCCKTITEGCGKGQRTDAPSSTIRDVGCRTEILDVLGVLLVAVGGVALGLSVILVIGILMACCLSRTIRNEGYLVA